MMSCLVAAAQIGSYLGLPQDGRGSALIRICAMYGCPAQRSISSTLFSGSSMARQIDPRHRSCQLLLTVQPVVGLPVVEGHRHRVLCLRDARRVRGGLQDRDIRAGLHDQLLERQLRVAAGELAVGGKRVERAWRRCARSRVRRSRSGRRPCGCRSTCCATARGCTAPARRRGARGGRRSRRTARRSVRGRVPGDWLWWSCVSSSIPLLCRSRGRRMKLRRCRCRTARLRCASTTSRAVRCCS